MNKLIKPLACIALLSLFLLGGCGQKGPLHLEYDSQAQSSLQN